MSGRDPPRLEDRDDWFAGPGHSTPSRGRSTAPVETEAGTHEEPASADNWLEGEPAADRSAGQFGGVIPSTRVSGRTVLIGAVIVVMLIVAGLAIGGVFSGGKHPPATPTTAPSPTTQPQSTTPTTHPTRRVPTAPATTLKPGDQGLQVRRLQRVLASLGYSIGAADGVYGPATQAALTRFQNAHALTADGVLGPRTLRALKQTLR